MEVSSREPSPLSSPIAPVNTSLSFTFSNAFPFSKLFVFDYCDFKDPGIEFSLPLINFEDSDVQMQAELKAKSPLTGSGYYVIIGYQGEEECLQQIISIKDSLKAIHMRISEKAGYPYIEPSNDFSFLSPVEAFSTASTQSYELD